MSVPCVIFLRSRRSVLACMVSAAWGLLLALFAWPGSASAQDFQVRSWQMEDGLPDATITALAQTPDGYLWLGTPKGLVRFDGAQFKGFAAGQATGLPEARIGGLLVDRHGVLWVSGAGGSLARYEHGRFQMVSPAGDLSGSAATGFVTEGAGTAAGSTRWMWGRISELVEDGEGAVWLVVAGRGLLRWREGVLAFFTPTNGLPAGKIDALCSDGSGSLWLIAGNTLYGHRDGCWQASPGAGPLGGPLSRLAPARAGGLWAATPRGSWDTGGGWVRRFADDQWFAGLEPTPWTPNSLRSQVTTLLEDRSGRLWLGTLWGGVFYSDAAGRWQRLRNEGSLSQCIITCLFEDRQSAVWVGTVGEGLHRIARRPVTMLTLPSPANENIINASTVTRDGSVWIGTDAAGAFRYREGSFGRFDSDQGLTNQSVCTLLEDCRTNLWVGTWGGLFKFADGRFARVSGPPELGLSVLALFEDRAGKLWIGTPRGPVCWDGRTFSVHRLAEDGGEFDIRSFAEDPAGNLWVGTIGQGLFRLGAGRVERFGPGQGLPSLNARSLFCDAAGGLWIGTDGAGLFRFEDGHFTSFIGADGWPNSNITSFITDLAGNLWMGSDNGLLLCAPDWLANYRRGLSPTLLGLRLSLGEGLASRRCSGSGQPVPSRSADGRLWFPNMRGLAVFDPRTINVELSVPAVLIESLAVDGAELPLNVAGELRVSSSARRFEFHYTAPELATPQALRFRHKLEGMDGDWVYAGTLRAAYYSQLPPGKYQFRVMAGGTGGSWREDATPLAFRVVPQVWEVRWVQVLLGVVLVAGVIAGLALIAQRRLARQVERLRLQQALESERRRIARDLHDDVGSQLTEIVLLGELAKRGEQSPTALRNHVGGLTQKVRQLVTVMEEVVWTVNPKNDSLPNLASYLADYTERFLALAQLSCRLEVDPQLPPIPVNASARHSLLLAVKEALNNVARHAAASQVQLDIHAVGGELQVTVADDGRGFDPQRPAHVGNGLPNLRNRLETLGGRTDIRSAPGQGTTITFGLPMPKLETLA